jgi:hypothetical protein
MFFDCFQRDELRSDSVIVVFICRPRISKAINQNVRPTARIPYRTEVNTKVGAKGSDSIPVRVIKPPH